MDWWSPTGRWTVVGVAVVVLLVLGVSVATLAPSLFRPCAGVYSAQAPDTAFDFTGDATAGTLTVAHAGGDVIDGDQRCTYDTDAIAVLVDDGGDRETVWWVVIRPVEESPPSGIEEPPLTRGDALRLREPDSTADADATLAGALDDGDTVRVVWYGAGNAATLAKCTVGVEPPDRACRREA